MLNIRGLAEVACSRRGWKRRGVEGGMGMLEQLRHSHSPLGRFLGSTGGSLKEGGRGEGGREGGEHMEMDLYEKSPSHQQ